jgi:predicted P-loop ATPase
LFSGKKYIGKQELNSEVGGQLTDDITAAVCIKIRDKFKFDPGLSNTRNAINLYCREHGFHPVREYLEQCDADWQNFDGKPRIDRMLIDYFKSPDTPFIRAVSRLVMVASVRRIFEPGCKFDYMTVLESPEGWNKSQSLITLYGTAWHTDNSILGMSNKELQETVAGKWCIECAELSGMRDAKSVEKIKNQLSKIEDGTRLAYGHYRTDAPRSCVFFGTTNDLEYLRSQTGNRRFFPVPVGRIDIAGLARDRDLLWGEAVAAHLTGESIMLPESLWAAAGVEQDMRTLGDPWIELVANVSARAASWPAKDEYVTAADKSALGVVYQNDGAVERVTSAFLLWKIIGIPPAQQTAEHGKRLGLAMRKNGWRGPKVYWIGSRSARGFERDIAPREPWDDVS